MSSSLDTKMAVGIVNALMSLLWLSYVLFRFDLFNMLGRIEITVMVVALLAAVAL